MTLDQLRPCDLCREQLQLRQLTFWRISLQHFGFVTRQKVGDDVALLLDETLDLFVCEGCACGPSHPIQLLGEMARSRNRDRKLQEPQGREPDHVSTDSN